MSGLEGLSLACNIFEVISFAVQTISACKDIYNGEPTQPSILQEKADTMRAVATRIHEACGAMNTTEEKKLAGTAIKCQQVAQQLEEKSSYGNAAALQYMAGGSCSCFSHHGLRLIVIDGSTTAQAIQLRQRQDFNTLEADLQHFIAQIAAGHTLMEDLVREEHCLTREAVKTEHLHTRKMIALESQTVQAAVASELQGSHTKTTNEQQHQRLIASFKFQEMNERYHQIHEADDSTFQRIFRSYITTAGEQLENEDAFEEETGDGSSATERNVSSEDTAEIDHIWNNFVEWLQSDNRSYWIQGKPGSGKSTLVKFLVEHRATENLLDQWSKTYRKGAKTTILSYFFWKIGTKSQNTIRGLLCSLIHQYLSKDNMMVGYILDRFQTAASNDSPYDWSIKTLRDMLFTILDKSTQALCIFIDGLDEVCDDDGPEPLLDIVDQLTQHGGVKVCVSSRPERTFEKRLARFPGLKLHQLTEPDMHRYVCKELGAVSQYVSDELHRTLAVELVYSAHGVFLWLCLVTRSIKNGIKQGDTEEDLYERLRVPRGDLNKLYEDMWSRLQDDELIYRATAAKYFWLVIMNKETPELRMSFKKPLDPDGLPYWGLSLFEMMVTRNSTVQEALFSKRDAAEVSYEALEGHCKKIQYNIENRCAGLLEVLPATDLLAESSESPTVVSKLGLFTHLATRVDFIHRSAHDFLTDTEIGQRIMGTGETSPTEIGRLRLRARLCMARAAHQHFGLQFGIGPLVANLAALAVAEGSSTQAELPLVSAEMVVHLRDAYNDEVVVGFFEPYRTFWRRSHGDHFLFLSWLTPFPEFDELVSRSIKKLGSSALATRVLWEAWSIYGWAGGKWPSRKLTEALMAAGGDPHAPGFSPWVPCHSGDSPSGDLPYLVRQRTAFSFLMEGSVWRYHRRGSYPWMYRGPVEIGLDLTPELLHVADAMAATCLDLDQTISLVGQFCPGVVWLVPPIPYFSEDTSETEDLIFFEASLQLSLQVLWDWFDYFDRNALNDAPRRPNMPTGTDQLRIRLRFLRPASGLSRGCSYLKILSPKSFDDFITSIFPTHITRQRSDYSAEYDISKLMGKKSEMEYIDANSIPCAFVQELSDCHLHKDISKLDLDGIASTAASADQVIDLMCHASGLNKA
ncbi:hypothetical protein S40288_07409 [Stachybotrys chartarum IBT 40288]|nr:hypothetical protein S40288_07409 [Stachybotrys chartarum IBT 40288]